MTTLAVPFQTLEELRDFIYRWLCRREQLVEGVYQMTQRILWRRNRPCGVYFCLHGPRAVKFAVVWDLQRQVLLFYDPTGQRYQTTRLLHPPQFHAAAESLPPAA